MDEADVKTFIDHLAATFVDGDWSILADHYAPDGLFIRPGAGIQDTGDYFADFGGFLKNPPQAVQHTIRDVRLANHLAVLVVEVVISLADIEVHYDVTYVVEKRGDDLQVVHSHVSGQYDAYLFNTIADLKTQMDRLQPPYGHFRLEGVIVRPRGQNADLRTANEEFWIRSDTVLPFAEGNEVYVECEPHKFHNHPFKEAPAL